MRLVKVLEVRHDGTRHVILFVDGLVYIAPDWHNITQKDAYSFKNRL